MNDLWTVNFISDENGGVILPLPEELMEKMLWKSGDVLECQLKGRDCLLVKNLSVQRIYASKLRRDLNTIIRKISTDAYPLNRVLIKKRCGKTITVSAV